MKRETVAEFLARGGKIEKVVPCFDVPNGKALMQGAGKVKKRQSYLKALEAARQRRIAQRRGEPE